MQTLASRNGLGVLAAFGLGTCTLALLVSRFDAVAILGAVMACAGMAVLCIWRDAPTVCVVVILYANVPALVKDTIPLEVSAAGLAGLLAIPVAHHAVNGRESLRIDAPLLMMLAFFAVLIASSLGAVSLPTAVSRVGLYVGEGLALYWLVLNAVRTRETLRSVMWAVVFTAAVLSSLPLYQAVTGDYEQQFGGLASRALERDLDVPVEEPRMRRADRAGGPVDGANRFAQILLVVLPLSAYLAWSGSGTARIAAMGATALIGIATVLTYSRGAFIAVMLMLPLLVAFRYVRPSRLTIVLLVFLPIVSIAAPAYVNRIATIQDSVELLGPNARTEPDGAIRGRATEMLAAVMVFLEHPILGVGPGQYYPYYSADYHAYFEFRDLPRPRRAHNLFLEIAAETGVVGLACFLATILLPLRRLWQHRRRWAVCDPGRAHLATAFLFSVLAYLTTGLFLHLAFERYLWLLLGMSGAAHQLLKAGPAVRPEEGARHAAA